MEAIQVAARFLEVSNPSLGLDAQSVSRAVLSRLTAWRGVREKWAEVWGTGGKAGTIDKAHLCDHHMAVKGSPSIRAGGAVDVRTNFGDNRGAEGHVGHKMAVHDVDLGRVSGIASNCGSGRRYVKPISALGHGVGACFAQLCEVGRQDRGRDDCGGRHGGRLCCEVREALHDGWMMCSGANGRGGDL